MRGELQPEVRLLYIWLGMFRLPLLVSSGCGGGHGSCYGWIFGKPVKLGSFKVAAHTRPHKCTMSQHVIAAAGHSLRCKTRDIICFHLYPSCFAFAPLVSAFYQATQSLFYLASQSSLASARLKQRTRKYFVCSNKLLTTALQQFTSLHVVTLSLRIGLLPSACVDRTCCCVYEVCGLYPGWYSACEVLLCKVWRSGRLLAVASQVVSSHFS